MSSDWMGSLSLALQANKYCLMPGYCFDLIVSEEKKRQKKKDFFFCKLEPKLGRSSLMSSLQENHGVFFPFHWLQGSLCSSQSHLLQRHFNLGMRLRCCSVVSTQLLINSYSFLILNSLILPPTPAPRFSNLLHLAVENTKTRVFLEADRVQEMIMLSNHLPVSSQIILNCIVLWFISGLIVLSLYSLDLIS